MTIVNNNAPEVLVKLAEKWETEGKSFYLGPENIFLYNNAPVNYYGADDVSRDDGSWSIHSSDSPIPPCQFLRKSEIEEIAEAFGANAKPRNSTLFLSNKCCSRCFMCWYHGEDTTYFDNVLKNEHRTVDLETAKKWVDKLCEVGITQISIAANGETLVLPYWEELMKYTAKKGLKQYFITNGFLLTEEVAQKLKAIGNIEIAEVSLHATDFETWSDVTRIKSRKMYENAINAPNLLKKIGIENVFVAFVRTERNIHQYKAFLDKWISKGFIVSSVSKLSDRDFPGNNYYDQFNEPLGLCECSRGNIYVMPSGKIVPCGSYYFSDSIAEGLYENLPNIDEMSVEELKNYSKQPINETQKKICKNCFNYYRRGILISKTVYGYPATCDGVSLRIQKRKTLAQRVNIELNSVKRHWKEFKSSLHK